MSIRDLSFPQDLDEMADMLAESFQYPENPEWSVQEDEREALVSTLHSLKRSWWMIKIGQLFIPAMRELLPGLVWQEDGRIAGLVMVQRRGSSDQWMVGTVATHPAYRRRGIARKLVEAGVEFMRAKGARRADLDVIDGNLPAYSLYESVGFIAYSSNLNLELTPRQVIAKASLPGDYTIEATSIFDWRPRFELIKRITPPEVQAFAPVEESRFRQPGYLRLVLPIIARAQRSRSEFWLVRHHPGGQVVGTMSTDTQTGTAGRHSISLNLDGAHAALSGALLGFGLNRVTSVNPDLVIEMPVPLWQPWVIEAAQAAGFSTRQKFNRMGITL